MRVSAVVDYAQAGELKFGQVGIANLRVRTLDVAQLAAEMRDRVQRAPNLFARAAVVLDFGGLSQVPAVDEARALLEGFRPQTAHFQQLLTVLELTVLIAPGHDVLRHHARQAGNAGQ